MTHHWDEFSKSLAEAVPRRESLRRLGAVIAGAVISPLGLPMASAGHNKPSSHKKTTSRQQQDPCKSFCRCRNKRQQNDCLAVCRACNNDPIRLGGSCGNYFCCGEGQTACSNYCADLASDPYNCGACGYVCVEPGPWEEGACILGECLYRCVEGAVVCDGVCTSLDWDPFNCGECGNVCPESAPYCGWGVCHAAESCPVEEFGVAWCPGVGCTWLLADNANCGACGVQCTDGSTCVWGSCMGPGDGLY